MFLKFSRTDVKTTESTVSAAVRKGQLEPLGTDEKRISVTGLAIGRKELEMSFFFASISVKFWVILQDAHMRLSLAEWKPESSLNNGKLEINTSCFREGGFEQTSDLRVCDLPLRDPRHVTRGMRCRDRGTVQLQRVLQPPLMKMVHRPTITKLCTRQNINMTCLSSTIILKLSKGWKSLKTAVVMSKHTITFFLTFTFEPWSVCTV